MDKRIFQIDKDCYIIYTGQSSADNKSFLRIGVSMAVTEDIQNHIRYIVVNDASSIDIDLEKENIQYMEKGSIKYICNKKNQTDLFKKLKSKGVDTEHLYIRNLSQDMDNISRIENKKHFFTIFYDNKNVKLVSNEEVFFDLFEAKEQSEDGKTDTQRLGNFISLLDNLNAKCKEVKSLRAKGVVDGNTIKNMTAFIIQDDIFVPLNFGMFSLEVAGNNAVNINFNSSQRFTVGKEFTLSLLDKGTKKYNISGLLMEGEVLESMVLYNYKCKINFEDDSSYSYFVQFYKNLFNKI